MKTIAGIVAEFNPFHEGHRYLIETVKTTLKPDVLVIILSGNFSSRGLPCMETRTVRTQKALEAGADLVIGLPSVYAMQSADYFAKYAIQSLKTAGVNVLCFGSESNDPDLLDQQLQTLETMDKDPSLSLARNAAKNGVAPRPNDILALQYLKTAKALDIAIRPLQRSPNFESATSIRSHYFSSQGRELHPDFEPHQNWDSYYPLLRYALLETPASRLAGFFLVEDGIENRMIKAARDAQNWTEFLEAAVSKTYSRARIQRTAMMILMQIEKEEVKANASFFAIQVLGFNTTGQKHLASLPEDAPVYSRIREVPEPLKTWLIKSDTLYSFFTTRPAGWKVQTLSDSNPQDNTSTKNEKV